MVWSLGASGQQLHPPLPFFFPLEFKAALKETSKHEQCPTHVAMEITYKMGALQFQHICTREAHTLLQKTKYHRLTALTISKEGQAVFTLKKKPQTPHQINTLCRIAARPTRSEDNPQIRSWCLTQPKAHAGMNVQSSKPHYPTNKHRDKTELWS